MSNNIAAIVDKWNKYIDQYYLVLETVKLNPKYRILYTPEQYRQRALEKKRIQWLTDAEYRKRILRNKQLSRARAKERKNNESKNIADSINSN